MFYYSEGFIPKNEGLIPKYASIPFHLFPISWGRSFRSHLSSLPEHPRQQPWWPGAGNHFWKSSGNHSSSGFGAVTGQDGTGHALSLGCHPQPPRPGHTPPFPCNATYRGHRPRPWWPARPWAGHGGPLHLSGCTRRLLCQPRCSSSRPCSRPRPSLQTLLLACMPSDWSLVQMPSYWSTAHQSLTTFLLSNMPSGWSTAFPSFTLIG